MKCLARIELQPGAETYCQLQRGHEGSHSYGAKRVLRCQSKNSQGLQCGLPNNHFGQHKNGGHVSWP